MPPQPLALPPALPSELLTFILSHHHSSTTLLICQSRATFLSSLLDSVNIDTREDELSLPPHPDLGDSEQPSSPPRHVPNPQKRHPLLIPTLHQIATSRNITLVFIPTISHLRAYLSVLSSTFQLEGLRDKGGNKPSLLVAYGLIELHRDTSEWSAQGLGHSIAVLVEAGARCRWGLVVVEEKRGDDGEGEDESEHMRDDTNLGDEEGQDEEEEEKQKWKRKCKVWEQRVPMLNGSVRRVGLESEEGGWSGRTVEVGRILGRWFKFGRGNWDI